MKNRVIDINHQLQRTSWGEYIIEPTKINAGTRKLPMTEDVYQMFKAMHWEHRFNHSDISVTMNVYTHLGFDDKYP